MWFERDVFCLYIRFECSGVSRMGLKKKKNWIGGWVGGLSPIQFFFGLLAFL